MATTPNFNIVYPVVGTTLTPLANHFANLANSVDTALTKAGATANSVTARNALFPSPVQGDRVFRTDLMKVEQYYGAYNSVSNPSGASVAGWYQAGSAVARTRTAAFNISTTTTVLDFDTAVLAAGGALTYAGGTVTCLISGTVAINATVTAQTASVFFNVRIYKNGVTQRSSGMATSTVSYTSNTITTLIPVVAGDTLDIRTNAGGSIAGVPADSGSAVFMAMNYVN